MEWHLKTAPAIKRLVTPRVLAHGAIPVLLSATGQYPVFVSESGETSRERAHVMVSFAESMSHGPQGSDFWIDHVYVYAVGSLEKGRQKTLPVASYQKCQPARTGDEIQALVDSLAPQIAEALDLCDRMEEIFKDAAQRIEAIDQLAERCVTREGYEAACATAGVEAISDAEISTSYGITYGQYSFPEYSPEVIIKIGLARYRRRSLEAEAKGKTLIEPEATATVPAKSGQLWEPCRCGKMPVYMPLHLCDACWPKTALKQ